MPEPYRPSKALSVKHIIRLWFTVLFPNLRKLDIMMSQPWEISLIHSILKNYHYLPSKIRYLQIIKKFQPYKSANQSILSYFYNTHLPLEGLRLAQSPLQLHCYYLYCHKEYLGPMDLSCLKRLLSALPGTQRQCSCIQYSAGKSLCSLLLRFTSILTS